jgi:hypothetical protein
MEVQGRLQKVQSVGESQLNSEIERLATSALALGQLQVKYARIRQIYECNS